MKGYNMHHTLQARLLDSTSQTVGFNKVTALVLQGRNKERSQRAVRGSNKESKLAPRAGKMEQGGGGGGGGP